MLYGKQWNLKCGWDYVKKRYGQIDLSNALSDGGSVSLHSPEQRQNKEERKEKRLKCSSALMEKGKSGSIGLQTDRAQASPTASGHSPTLTDAVHIC